MGANWSFDSFMNKQPSSLENAIAKKRERKHNLLSVNAAVLRNIFGMLHPKVADIPVGTLPNFLNSLKRFRHERQNPTLSEAQRSSTARQWIGSLFSRKSITSDKKEGPKPKAKVVKKKKAATSTTSNSSSSTSQLPKKG